MQLVCRRKTFYLLAFSIFFSVLRRLSHMACVNIQLRHTCMQVTERESHRCHQGILMTIPALHNVCGLF